MPQDIQNYIDHTVHGQSIRSVARASGVHPSTVLRRVRKLEGRREDPLVDEAIDNLSIPILSQSAGSQMTPISNHQTTINCLASLTKEGAFLALASDMENAVVMREVDGCLERGLIVTRAEAQKLALNEWIEQFQNGRISKYRITPQGQAALKRLLVQSDDPAGFSEAPKAFEPRNPDWKHRIVFGPEGMGVQRQTVSDSPLTLLARRKGKDGQPYLNADLISAGERLREDFELSQSEPSVTQNWQSFLTGPNPVKKDGNTRGKGAQDALDRFQAAMEALGPGLSEIALHCCCHQRGVEQAEKKMGWSARSGKVVLRIALQRLQLHYEEVHGRFGPMIG